MPIAETAAARLEQYLRTAVGRGLLETGERLPPAARLAAEHGVSARTVREVVSRLVAEGWLTRTGRGVTAGVAARPPSARPPKVPPAVLVLGPNASRSWREMSAWPGQVLRGFAAAWRRGRVPFAPRFAGELAALREHERELPADQAPVYLICDCLDSALRRHLQAAAERGSSVVLFAQDPRDQAWALQLDVSGRAGVLRALAHLRQLGHRHLAFGRWYRDERPGRLWFCRDRELAYTDWAGAHDQPVTMLDVPFALAADRLSAALTADFDRRVTAFLAGRHPPTGLVCVNDRQALRVLEACRRVGVAVPGQLSVVGFDDEPAAAAASLTTLARPLMVVGDLAAHCVLRALAPGGTRCSGALFVDPYLVARGSTGPRA